MFLTQIKGPDGERFDMVAIGGTLFGNALSMAAARATMLEVLTPDAYAHTQRLGARARRRDARERRDAPGSRGTSTRSARAPATRSSPQPIRNAAEGRACADDCLTRLIRIWLANRGVWEAIVGAGPVVPVPGHRRGRRRLPGRVGLAGGAAHASSSVEHLAAAELRPVHQHRLVGLGRLRSARASRARRARAASARRCGRRPSRPSSSGRRARRSRARGRCADRRSAIHWCRSIDAARRAGPGRSGAGSAGRSRSGASPGAPACGSAAGAGRGRRRRSSAPRAGTARTTAAARATRSAARTARRAGRAGEARRARGGRGAPPAWARTASHSSARYSSRQVGDRVRAPAGACDAAPGRCGPRTTRTSAASRPAGRQEPDAVAGRHGRRSARRPVCRRPVTSHRSQCSCS